MTTLSKASLGEALVEFDAWEDGSVNSLNDLPLVQAARFVERLLPAECPDEECVNGIYGVGEGGRETTLRHHEACYGTGQLWDEGLVEVVAKAIYADRPFDEFDRVKARAVLSALTQEVGK